MPQRNGFRQVLIQLQRPGNRAGNLRHLQRMGQAGPVMVSLRGQKYLSLVFQPAKRFAV